MKLLIIEDEPVLRDSILEYLERQGYICESANDFKQALEKVREFDYDCIVADITLPLGNGLDIVKELKSLESHAGIIIISAKDALEDKLKGLELGADDYLTKPFHLSELNARINAILRRKNFDGNTIIRFNEITVIPASQTVLVNNNSISLTGKEYQLLLYFIANQRRVVTKSALASHLWGDEYDSAGSYDFIYTHIKNLRKKMLEANGEDYINTVYGTGYRFG
ncbi:DNA-binding response regulator, OmpR family, contains REC and winged-helix (wHTH) domain [Chitinophaga terrae (ex Kim and Jung 2007)]|uniref:DNA-binding response regulator, OmpR family, contains REC and winged-helix (WHTH) domain n=1 Tax=Chitinophaga terrae (ex Kim and Jung 2007) TaxID=408074 RepID=A0A1H3YRJ7_9BACT|nr:response regulator transcription factor [Chitinophaga terrae (ex Kim and Jung 2007)]GEP88462.1 DNA-binding response regulator [Chitinophaga terrae (ex Kim and Jung 2007)]SEA14027.1 DNA-binding response regulator, OmpR family, contains REC and winged-helix (wHTH) domain [Chitinophaga terrae (ex Kim and Jung 2007)]